MVSVLARALCVYISQVMYEDLKEAGAEPQILKQWSSRAGRGASWCGQSSDIANEHHQAGKVLAAQV